MRGGNLNVLPSKIYFYKDRDRYFGPYTNRPTGVMKKITGGILMIYVRDTTGNYILE